MSTIKIVITKGNIYDRIFSTSAYTARARETLGLPDGIVERMQLTADDRHVIDPMIDSSADEIYGEITRYHPGSSVELTEYENGINYEFSITLPATAINWQGALKAILPTGYCRIGTQE